MHKSHFGLTKKLHFLVDQMDYWPKVPNILAYRFSLKNIHFPLLSDIFVRNLIKKVPNHLQGSKDMTSKVQKESQGPVLKVYFE